MTHNAKKDAKNGDKGCRDAERAEFTAALYEAMNAAWTKDMDNARERRRRLKSARNLNKSRRRHNRYMGKKKGFQI